MDRVQGKCPHVLATVADYSEKAKAKAIALLSPKAPTTPAAFSEFGTRRRRSFQVQDLVLRGLIEGHEELKAKGGKHGVLTGTSNVCSLLPSYFIADRRCTSH
jgi:nicotinic acid phosphoribosyltransferase